MNMDGLQRGLATLTIRDEKPISPEEIDNIATRLNDDWLSFARKVPSMPSHEIAKIERSFQNAKEKCFAVFKVWDQISDVEITVGMVKLILMRMQRNDILLDVFNVNVGNNQIQERQPERQPVDEGLTLSKLKLKHKKRLQSYLDPDHGAGIKNWVHIGHQLCLDDRELSARVDSLRLHYAGGGSPAMAFLESLAIKHPETTVERFRGVAKDFDRNDIALYIRDNKIDVNEQLRNIDHEHLEKITNMLNKHVAGISDWRSFADEFDYSTHDISNFATTVKGQNSYSPTLKLLELLQYSKPTLTLNQFATACERLQRRDVSKYIRDVIQELGGN